MLQRTSSRRPARPANTCGVRALHLVAAPVAALALFVHTTLAHGGGEQQLCDFKLGCTNNNTQDSKASSEEALAEEHSRAPRSATPPAAHARALQWPDDPKEHKNVRNLRAGKHPPPALAKAEQTRAVIRSTAT